MILWLNGPFGGDKTTTANLLSDQPGWRLFDPEHVGYLLAGNLRDRQFDDFQDLPPRRALVPAVAHEISRFTGVHLVAAQTVLRQPYWSELMAGLHEREIPVFHVALKCERSELIRRIEADEAEAGARD